MAGPPESARGAGASADRFADGVRAAEALRSPADEEAEKPGSPSAGDEGVARKEASASGRPDSEAKAAQIAVPAARIAAEPYSQDRRFTDNTRPSS